MDGWILGVLHIGLMANSYRVSSSLSSHLFVFFFFSSSFFNLSTSLLIFNIRAPLDSCHSTSTAALPLLPTQPFSILGCLSAVSRLGIRPDCNRCRLRLNVNSATSLAFTHIAIPCPFLLQTVSAPSSLPPSTPLASTSITWEVNKTTSA